LALEAQEAERKYQEIKNRIDESQALFEKGPQNGELNIDKQQRDVSGNWNSETPQDVEAEGKGGNSEDSSLDVPGPKPRNSTPKLPNETGRGDDLPLPLSKIELLLSRIAGAQEAIVLATEKQGSFDRSTDPFPTNSAPIPQRRSAGAARMIKEVDTENSQQESREPETRHQRPILDGRSLDRMRNVRERFTGSLGLLQRDSPFRRSEYFNLEEDHISRIPKEGSEMSQASEESHEEVPEGDDTVAPITREESTGEGEGYSLRLGQDIDRLDSKVESDHWEKAGWNSLMTSAFKNNESSSLESSTRWGGPPKGKDKQTTDDQAMSKLPLNTPSAENPAPFEKFGIEWVQRLTSSTGALVLHVDHSRWIRGITHPPGVSSIERKHHSQSPSSWPSSPSLAANRSSNLDAGYALEAQLSPLVLRDTLETHMGMETDVERSPTVNESSKSAMEQKKIKQNLQSDPQSFEEVLSESEILDIQETGARSHDYNERGHRDTKGESARDREFSTRETTDHNQVNYGTPASEEQLGSLVESTIEKHDDFDDADLLPNDEVIDTTNNQKPTLSTHPRSSASDDEVIIIQNIPALDHRDLVTGAGSPNAATANNHDPDISPEEHSSSVGTIALPSRFARLRALLQRRSIVRRKDAKTEEDALGGSQDFTISTNNGRKGKNRNHGLRTGLFLAALFRRRRFRRRRSRFKRLVFLQPCHAS
jgi:hypothetical protein